MAEAKESHAGCDQKTKNIEGDLNLGIRFFDDLGKISWEQVGWDDGELAAVGKGNTEAQDQVAGDEVKYPQGNTKRQCIDPDPVDIHHFSKSETSYKAEQIAGNETLF